jgi:hypothetical protein
MKVMVILVMKMMKVLSGENSDLSLKKKPIYKSLFFKKKNTPPLACVNKDTTGL